MRPIASVSETATAMPNRTGAKPGKSTLLAVGSGCDAGNISQDAEKRALGARSVGHGEPDPQCRRMARRGTRVAQRQIE
jgi:hypothetical protein